MKPIFIVGYMGSGKTTFGRALARKLRVDFIDLDFYIEQRYHSKITDIFAQKGEEDFRRMESNMLREVGEFDNVVIACGGGTPCFLENMEYMNSRGVTVLLQTNIDRLLQRYRLKPDKRPLLAGKSEEELRLYVERHIEQRMPYYSKAQHVIESGRLEDKKQIETTVNLFLSDFPLP